MIEEREVRVCAYSGHQAEERPVSFWYGEKQILVKRILQRWYQEEVVAGGGRRSCFQVEGHDGHIYRLCYHAQKGTWFLTGGP